MACFLVIEVLEDLKKIAALDVLRKPFLAEKESKKADHKNLFNSPFFIRKRSHDKFKCVSV
jgi:hypothetical protein